MSARSCVSRLGIKTTDTNTNKGAPLKSPGTVLRTRMNADHADLNPRVSAQIRVPFSFCVFLKLKTSECERRILSLAGLESNAIQNTRKDLTLFPLALRL